MRWEDVQGRNYQKGREFVDDIYKTDLDFRNTINRVATEFYQMRRRSKKKLPTPEQHEALVEFLLKEIPTAIFGFRFQGTQYNLIVHPISKPSQGFSNNPFSAALALFADGMPLREQAEVFADRHGMQIRKWLVDIYSQP